MGIEFTGTFDAPVQELFDWHSRRGTLTRLIPPSQPMRAMTEASSLADGRAVPGLPGEIRWHAQHRRADFDPPHRFVDERVVSGLRSLPPALAGPWRHEHCFTEQQRHRTRLTHRVDTVIHLAGEPIAGRLDAFGHRFRRPHLTQCLRHQLGRLPEERTGL